MSTLLEEAIARLRALPEDRRDDAAAAMLGLVEAFEGESTEGLSDEELAAARDILSSPRKIASPEAVAHAFRRRAP